MKRDPASDAITQVVSDPDEDNAAAVITLTPPNGEYVCLDWVAFSYTADPAAARTLTITVNGSVKLKQYITKGGFGKVNFRSAEQEGLCGNRGEVIVITLQASGTGGVLGALTAAYR